MGEEGMQLTITKEDVDNALAPNVWDLGNEALYSLCRRHPEHKKNDVIVAKIWLIGRSYAAALERRKNASESSDRFYEEVVTEKIRKSELDAWLRALPLKMTDPWNGMRQIIDTHKHMTDLFEEITALKKRSLASKYLHFHRPDLFFIYDARARRAINRIVPLASAPAIEAAYYDAEYLRFCRQAQCLREHIKELFHVTLTPRQLDNILLRATSRS